MVLAYRRLVPPHDAFSTDRIPANHCACFESTPTILSCSRPFCSFMMSTSRRLPRHPMPVNILATTIMNSMWGRVGQPPVVASFPLALNSSSTACDVLFELPPKLKQSLSFLSLHHIQYALLQISSGPWAVPLGLLAPSREASERVADHQQRHR